MIGRLAFVAGSGRSVVGTGGPRHTQPERPAFYAGDWPLQTGKATVLCRSPAHLVVDKSVIADPESRCRTLRWSIRNNVSLNSKKLFVFRFRMRYFANLNIWCDRMSM